MNNYPGKVSTKWRMSTLKDKETGGMEQKIKMRNGVGEERLKRKQLK